MVRYIFNTFATKSRSGLDQFFFLGFYRLESKSTLPLSSDNVKVTSNSVTHIERREAIAQNQIEEDVQQLPRESGDGASAVPSEVEATTAYKVSPKSPVQSL